MRSQQAVALVEQKTAEWRIIFQINMKYTQQYAFDSELADLLPIAGRVYTATTGSHDERVAFFVFFLVVFEKKAKYFDDRSNVEGENH